MFIREAIVEVIQPEGCRAPIVGVHGLGTDQRFYRPLAERLGPDQPVYGLWSPAEQDGDPDHFEVVEIARSYADKLDDLVPSGPVTLTAVSAASVVAFDLAQQLTARGRDVALLVLFDALGPGVAAITPSPSERLSIHLQELRRGPAGYAEGRARMLRSHFLRRVDLLTIRIRRALGASVEGDLMKRAFIERDVTLREIYDYQPYRGRVLIFKGGDDAFTMPLADRGMGWAELIEPDRLEVAVVPGGHLSLLAEPNVGELAEQLAVAHEKAVAKTGNRPVDNEG